MSMLIWKEMLEGLRGFKFLIIGFALLFFAFMDPLIMKFLPEILKSQTGMEGLAQLIVIDQAESMKSYLGDLTTIGPIVMAFTLGGTLTKEFHDHYLDMPLSKGLDLNRLYTAKWLVYSLFVLAAALLCILMNYLYAGMLFPGGQVAWAATLRSALMLGLMMVYFVSLHLLAETFTLKNYTAGILSLALFFGQYALMFLLPARLRYLAPHYLMTEGATLVSTLRAEDWTAMALTAIYSLALLFAGRISVDNKSLY